MPIITPKNYGKKYNDRQKSVYKFVLLLLEQGRIEIGDNVVIG